MNLCIKVYLLILCLTEAFSDNESVVETKLGKLNGKRLKTLFQKKSYISYFGIPYALAPIHNLRFSAPIPHEGWDGIRTADKIPRPCAQFYSPIRYKPNDHGYFGDEDCLVLNVHTPNTTDKMPVIVLLMNEQFRNALNYSKIYLPDFFIEEDVVVVNIQHRLSTLGFISTQDEIAPGNNGIRDIIVALKWVRDNIASFGGDSDKVTLMGYFGGAVAVDILLHSNKAKGLFSAAILQSGSSWQPSYYSNEQKDVSYKLAENLELKVGDSKDLIEKLRKVDSEKLLETVFSLKNPDDLFIKHGGKIPFGPTIESDNENAVITGLPESTKRIDVPLLVGYNSNEGISFVSRFLHKPAFLTYADRQFAIMFPVRKNFRFDFHDSIYEDAVKEIKDYYFDEGYVQTSKPGEYIKYIGDVLQAYPFDYMVKRYANISSEPIYYYYFNYSSDLNMNKLEVLSTSVTWDGVWGATIGDELCYLLLCKPLRSYYKNLFEKDSDVEELKVLRNMVRMWTNFAKSRNPTPENDVSLDFKWAPYTYDDQKLLIIDENGFRIDKNPMSDRIKFWDEFLEKYENIAIDGVVRSKHDEL